jgi:hypothetical protein
LIASTEALAKQLFGFQDPPDSQKKLRQAQNAHKWSRYFDRTQVVEPQRHSRGYHRRSASIDTSDFDVTENMRQFEFMLNSLECSISLVGDM